MKTTTILITCILTIVFAPTILAQTETLGAIQYSAPAGFTKSAKDHAVVFSQIDQAKGKFCFITLYAAAPSSGKAQSDFASEWKIRVVEPWKAEANPKTESVPENGWTAIAGGAVINFEGNKAFAFLTVISGFGKTVSVLAVLNDESYLASFQAFVERMDIDKTVAAAQNAAPREAAMSPASSAAVSTMNAGSLVREFEVNEIRAGQTYIGRVLRIDGTINTILVGKDGRIAITFKSTLGAYGNVRCYFSPSQSSRVAGLSAHTEAIVQGTVRGWEGGYSGAKVFVMLDDCIVP